MSAGAASNIALLDGPTMTRSIFFYNAEPQLGSNTGLHFFEPRYRLLAVRALSEQRQRQFIFLPSYGSYQASHGDIGILATIVNYRAVPDNNPDLPRADVMLNFTARVLVLFHWLEPASHGLHECTCVRIPDERPRADLGSASVVNCVLNHQARAGEQPGSYLVGGDGASVFAEPHGNHPASDDRLAPGSRLHPLETRGAWVRHEAGWSCLLEAYAGEDVLVPSYTLAAELRGVGVELMKASQNGYDDQTDTHFVLWAPTEQLARRAFDLLDEALPDRRLGRCIYPVLHARGAAGWCARTSRTHRGGWRRRRRRQRRRRRRQRRAPIWARWIRCPCAS